MSEFQSFGKIRKFFTGFQIGGEIQNGWKIGIQKIKEHSGKILALPPWKWTFGE
jgi:hypothetical protein